MYKSDPRPLFQRLPVHSLSLPHNTAGLCKVGFHRTSLPAQVWMQALLMDGGDFALAGWGPLLGNWISPYPAGSVGQPKLAQPHPAPYAARLPWKKTREPSWF